MRGNALLKLLMGGAGGVVLSVSGAQCQPNSNDGSLPQTYIATGTDTPWEMGYVTSDAIDWESLPRW